MEIISKPIIYNKQTNENISNMFYDYYLLILLFKHFSNSIIIYFKGYSY